MVLGHLVPELEQIKDRRFFEEVAHPKTGVNTHAGLPARWSSIPGAVLVGPAPMLGQDDDEVWLKQVAVEPGEYQMLQEQGVIGRGEAAALRW